MIEQRETAGVDVSRPAGCIPNVDMIAAARDAQWSAATFLGVDAVKVISPAKVNLFLSVGKRRPDGLHQVDTIMHALALHDTLYMSHESYSLADDPALLSGCAVGGPAHNIVVRVDVSDKTTFGLALPPEIPLEDNLAFRAVDALAKKIGYEEPTYVRIHIEKNIPLQAGLAGGSSNAAAALVAAAHFFGVSPSGKTLIEVASALGADVRFFLHGGCAQLAGVGEKLIRTLEPAKTPVVVVKPPFGVSTAEAYAAFDAAPHEAPPLLLARVEDTTEAQAIPLFNSLESAALSIQPELHAVQQWLCTHPKVPSAEEVLLCGSGAAFFAKTRTLQDAMAVATAARTQGWWARATTLSPLRVALVA